MVKAAWGKKHTCPKCGTRFYDLGKKGPAVCIECEHKWVPEQILKSKQVHVAPPKPPEAPKEPEKTAEKAEDAADGKADDAADAKDGDTGDKKGDEKGDGANGGDKSGKDDAGVLGDVSLDDEKGDLSGAVDTKLEQGGGE